MFAQPQEAERDLHVERALLTRFALGATFTLVAAVAVGCSGSGGEAQAEVSATNQRAPVKGAALNVGNWIKFSITGVNPIGVGQEVNLMKVPLMNRSSAPVVIRRVEPLLAPGSTRVARVIGFDVAPRRDDQAEYTPLAVYLGYPPLGEDPTGQCVRQRVVSAAGYVLEPYATGDRSVLIIRLHARAAGVFRMRGQRVVYEQDGELRYQDLFYEFSIRVKAGVKRKHSGEEACLE